jgi:phosphotransferase system  glucose/maltose/N-acetylglucosamine-specific IIC component
MGPPGHFAIAFAAKPVTPKAPLWLLLLATEVLDLLAFGFMAIGIEYGGPEPSLAWSHGLFMAVLWSIVAGAITFLVYRDRRTGLAIGLLVFSHWVLDFIAHYRDLPLTFNDSPHVGLGLESSIPIGIVMEFGMLAGGVAIYLHARKKEKSAASSQR